MLSGGIDVLVEMPPDNLCAVQRRFPTTAVHEQAGPHLWFLILNMKDGSLQGQAGAPGGRTTPSTRRRWSTTCCRAPPTVAAGPIPAAFAWAYNNDAQALSLRSGQGQAADQGGRRRRRQADLLRHRGRLRACSIRSPMGTAIQADLAAVGLKVKIETYRVEHLPGQGQSGPGGQGATWPRWLDDQRPRHPALPDAAHRGLAGQGRLQLGLLFQSRRSTSCWMRRAT